MGFRQWSQDLFCARKTFLEYSRKGVRGSRGEDNALGELNKSTISKIAKDIFTHQAQVRVEQARRSRSWEKLTYRRRRLQLDDVAAWWSTAASCFGMATDASLFLDTPSSRLFAVTEFASIQWQLHNLPRPEESTYVTPTPQLTKCVHRAVARLAKRPKSASMKNNAPAGKTFDPPSESRPKKRRPGTGRQNTKHKFRMKSDESREALRQNAGNDTVTPGLKNGENERDTTRPVPTSDKRGNNPTTPVDGATNDKLDDPRSPGSDATSIVVRKKRGRPKKTPKFDLTVPSAPESNEAQEVIRWV